MKLLKTKSVAILLAALTVLVGCASMPGHTATYEIQRDLAYSSPDGKPLLADVYIPAGPGPFPAVLVIHGGGWVNGERSDMDRYAKRLVKRGFVAVNISYRLAPAAIYPAQIEDCRAALRWTRAKAAAFKINPNRIGAFGYSAGAHLALLLGVQDSRDARVKAVVSGSAPTDLRKYPDSPLVNSLLGGPPAGREALYENASPIVHVSAGDAPTFLYHGKMDRLVEIEQSRDMAKALAAAGVKVELVELPFGHALSYFLDQGAFDDAVDFLARM